MRFFIPACLLITSLFTFEGCRKTYTLSEDQKILFQYSYIRDSGNTENQGFIIDKEGNVLIYNQPEKWNFPDQGSILTQAQVAENLKSCTGTGIKVPPAELKKFESYIINLAASKVSARKTTGTEKGTFNYYCFTYSSDDATYKQVTIRTHGDFVCENFNFFARKVAEWMNLILQGLPVRQL
jgi:hypothetical protein